MQSHPSPTYLYFPDKNKVLRILQLPHPFVGFTESFRLIGYLANANRELSPLYRAEHALINSEHDILDIVGILAIPNHDRIVFSEVYEKKMTGDGDFMRSIDSGLCRPNVLGFTSIVWLLSMLHDHSIRFHVAPFPDGFSPRGSLAAIEAAPLHDFMFPAPRAAIEVTPLIYQFPPPVTLAAIEAAPVAYELEAAPFQQSISPPPADGKCGSALFLPDTSSNGQSWSANFDYDFTTITGSEGYPDNSMFDDYQMAFNASVVYADQTPITPTIVLHDRLIWKDLDAPLHPNFRTAITEALKNTPWNRPIFLTKCLYLGSLWVGLQNPWNLPDQQYRRLITSCFLTAIALSGTTMDELHDKLVTVAKGGMEPATIGWETLRFTFSNHIVNRTSEMRKVVRGCIHTPTGFSGSQNQEKRERVNYFFALLDSDNQELVQQGIAELVQLHMFQELVWISLLRPIVGLAQNKNENGRIADLFPEEVRDHNGLAKGVVGTLVTIIYHTFHIWRSPKTQGRRLDLMYDFFMVSLIKMYANLDSFPEFKEAVRKLPFLREVNVFPMEPKSLRPRTRMNETTPLYEDLEPITEMVHNLTTLPNAEFTNDMIIKDEALSALQNQISKMSHMVHTACMGPLPVRDGKVLRPDLFQPQNVVAPHSLAGIKNSFILAVSKVKSALRYIMIIVTIRAIID
ncbi:uncharacterized protein F5891DRAFT_983562 [Suillus fuscotomentosus]|uniref:Uncharacterized protein n=1 Tax=Suillus fuscotomentosus TaxID=1912939 RepID=A0AAD4E168_9AGAM|nr:uncharacterized protein F5891DRAFT_983562 [Suillus fuscotomentosus]KAG1896388.1 hypothetical protein F5891DRAFT_983562 [Suillus fuscotomentosus]